MPLASGSGQGLSSGPVMFGTSAIGHSSRCRGQSEDLLGGFLRKPQTLDGTTVGHKHLLPMGDKSQPARLSG